MDVRGTAVRAGARLRAAVARRVRIDARALAAARIGLGGLVLVDLLGRSRDLVAFYTDAGVLPRALLAEQFPTLHRISLHALSGAGWYQGLLFVLAGGAALALAAGYRTRLATAATWLLLVSLHARNPVLLNSGDSLLRRLLFWSLFLPLGERWSVDACRRKTAPRRGVATVASGALLVQVLVVYLTNAVFKFRGATWPGGDAMAYVFSLDRLTVLLGDVIAEYPALYGPLDHAWLGLLLASPLLLLATGRVRALVAAALVAAHLGMALTLRLGIFPLVSVTSLLPFLPSPVWDGLGRRARAVLARRPALRGRLARARDRLGTLPAGPALPAGRVREAVVPAVVAVLLVTVLVWNGAALGYVEPPEGTPPAADPVRYRWDMFAPSPPRADVGFAVTGRTVGGERVDALRGGPAPDEWGAEVVVAYPTTRWMIYLLDVRRDRYAPLRPALADGLCRRWDARHATDLDRVSVRAVIEPIRLDGRAPVRRERVVAASCPDGGPS